MPLVHIQALFKLSLFLSRPLLSLFEAFPTSYPRPNMENITARQNIRSLQDNAQINCNPKNCTLPLCRKIRGESEGITELSKVLEQGPVDTSSVVIIIIIIIKNT